MRFARRLRGGRRYAAEGGPAIPDDIEHGGILFAGWDEEQALCGSNKEHD